MASRIQKELALLVTGKDVSASKTLRGVNKEVKNLQRAAGKAGTNIARNLERGVVVGAGAAVGAIGYAVKAAMDWDQAFSGVRKTLNATPAELAAIGTAIRKMSTEMPVAATELAAIAENAGALGIATGDVVEFTKVVALLGVTTDLTSEQAGTALGHLKTNLKLTGKDFEEVGNTLVSLGNNGASTESQILGMAESISGAANIVGLSAKEVLGWGAALANTGEEVEAGGTSLQKFFLGVFKMVNKGGGDLKLLAKTAGMTSAQFKKSFDKDASGTLERFIVQLGKMSKAEQTATLEKLGFTDIRITRAMLKLLGNTKNLTDSLGQSDAAWAANNAMQKEAEQRFKTTASQVTLLNNNVTDAAITIGSQLLPVINELAKEGIDWLHGHQGEIAQFAKDLAAGIRDAVKWAKSLDWNAIGNALKAGAGFAQGLIEAFAGAPPWLQEFLAVGFVANKFTGGAVQDVIGSLASGLIKGILGMNAGVVNINAGVVNGAGVGAAGAAGAPGGLRGALGTAASIASKVVVVGMVAEVADLIHGALSPDGGLQGRTDLGHELPADQLSWPWGPKNTPDLNFGPLEHLLGGDSSFKPAGSDPATLAAIEAQTNSIQRGVASSERTEAITTQAAAAQAQRDATSIGATNVLTATARSQLSGVISQVSAAKSTVASASASVAAAARAAGQVSAAAIKDKDLSVTTHVTVPVTTNVSVKETINSKTTYKKYQKFID